MATLRTREFLSEWFVAKITAIGSIVGSAPCNGVPHAWTTVTPCPDYSNVWVDPYFPVIAGTATAQPAYALDGLAAVVGDIVFMRLRGTPGGMNVYEFQRISGRAQWSSGAGAPSGGINGDWYYDTTGRRVYERVAGVWVVRTIPQWSSGAGAPGAGTGADTDWYWDTTNKKAYERVAGAWVFRFDSRLQWSSGSGAPSGGFDGDWYYRTSNKFVYEKVAGVWTARSVTSSVVTGITCVSGVLTATFKTLTVFGDVS